MRTQKRSAFLFFILRALGHDVGEGAAADASVSNEECDKDRQHVHFLDLGGLMYELTPQMCLWSCHSLLRVQPPCQTPFHSLRMDIYQSVNTMAISLLLRTQM